MQKNKKAIQRHYFPLDADSWPLERRISIQGQRSLWKVDLHNVEKGGKIER